MRRPTWRRSRRAFSGRYLGRQKRAILKLMAKTLPKRMDSEIDDATADAEALADLKAGRTVSHEKVKAWLRSWGKPDELSPPVIPGEGD
jgi:predicted transcriptional regulator